MKNAGNFSFEERNMVLKLKRPLIAEHALDLGHKPAVAPEDGGDIVVVLV